MKKLFGVIISLILFLLSATLISVADVAYADDQADVTLFSAAADYMKLDHPEQIAVSDDYVVARDGAGFSVLFGGKTKRIESPYVTNIDEMHIVGDHLVVFYNSENDRAFRLFDLSACVESDAGAFDVLNVSSDSVPEYPFSIAFDTESHKLYALYVGGCFSYDYNISNGIFSIVRYADNLVVKTPRGARSGAVKLAFSSGKLYFLQYDINEYYLGRFTPDGTAASVEQFRSITANMTYDDIKLFAGSRYVLAASESADKCVFQLFDTVSSDNYTVSDIDYSGISMFGNFVYISQAESGRIIRYTYSPSAVDKLTENGIFAYKGDADYLLDSPSSAL